jgi:hypothetical protein
MVVPLGADPVYCVFGYTGNGVGPSAMMGRAAASLALDRRDEQSRLALVDPAPRRVPAGLASWLGGNAIRTGVGRKGGRGGAGRDRRPAEQGLWPRSPERDRLSHRALTPR